VAIMWSQTTPSLAWLKHQAGEEGKSPTLIREAQHNPFLLFPISADNLASKNVLGTSGSLLATRITPVILATWRTAVQNQSGQIACEPPSPKSNQRKAYWRYGFKPALQA
jgi:hypothetical protein